MANERNTTVGAAAAAAASPVAGLSVQDMLTALRRWWWQCLTAGAILAAASCAIVWMTFKPKFDARALLKIQDRSPFIVFESQTASTVFAQTELETIRSPYVMTKVAAEPDVAGLSEAREAMAKDLTLMDWLTKSLKVNFIGRSELCEIHFQARDPEAAAKVANAVMDAYLASHRDGLGEHTERVIELLMDEQRNRKAELKQLQERVRVLTKKATGQEPIFMAGAHDVMLQQSPLAPMEDRLAASEVERAIFEAKLRVLEEDASKTEVEVPPGVLSQAIDSHPELQRLLQELHTQRALLRQYHDKKATGSAAEGLVSRLTADIKRREDALAKAREQLSPELRKEMEAMVAAQRQDQIDELRQKIDEQKLVEQTWRNRLDQQRSKYEKLGDEAVELEFARNELQRAEDVFTKIADRIVVLRTERRAPARAEALMRATPPPLPLERWPLKLFGLAVLASFGLPMGLAVLNERRLRRICDSEQVAAETNLLVLGEIASLPARLALPRRNGQERFLRERLVFEESVDNLRAGLTLSPVLRDCQVLTVTSAVSREGKTSLASSLAASLARHIHEPVLLVDADLRAPDLHDIFDAPLSPGLADVLNGKCDVEHAIVKTNETVHLLPAGKLIGNPHSTMRHGGLATMLEQLRPAYRYIIVDAPPVLAASEALTIAAAGDGTLVCAMREYSRAAQLRTACGRLANAGANLVGAVISGVPTRAWEYRYGYYGYDRFITAADAHGDDND